jgi:hypothetical protein
MHQSCKITSIIATCSSLGDISNSAGLSMLDSEFLESSVLPDSDGPDQLESQPGQAFLSTSDPLLCSGICLDWLGNVFVTYPWQLHATENLPYNIEAVSPSGYWRHRMRLL